MLSFRVILESIYYDVPCFTLDIFPILENWGVKNRINILLLFFKSYKFSTTSFVVFVFLDGFNQGVLENENKPLYNNILYSELILLTAKLKIISAILCWDQIIVWNFDVLLLWDHETELSVVDITKTNHPNFQDNAVNLTQKTVLCTTSLDLSDEKLEHWSYPPHTPMVMCKYWETKMMGLFF